LVGRPGLLIVGARPAIIPMGIGKNLYPLIFDILKKVKI
jgi:hypothetical protein